jgi:hypothetical protein
MNPKYTKYLFSKYEPLYQGHKKPVTQNLMSFGFECGDGWFRIINNLSHLLCSDWLEALQKLRLVEGRVGELIYPNWKKSEYNKIITNQMVDEAINNLESSKLGVPNAVQVKEKFGSLRFYCYNTTEIQEAYIRSAEFMSAVTCEVCGSPGKINRDGGWLRCLCKKHRKEENGVKDV